MEMFEKWGASHREKWNEMLGEIEKNGIGRIEVQTDLDEVCGAYRLLDRADLLLIGLLGPH